MRSQPQWPHHSGMPGWRDCFRGDCRPVAMRGPTGSATEVAGLLGPAGLAGCCGGPAAVAKSQYACMDADRGGGGSAAGYPLAVGGGLMVDTGWGVAFARSARSMSRSPRPARWSSM